MKKECILIEIQNEQGLEMGRPSQIMMRGHMTEGQSEIEIGGNCNGTNLRIHTTHP